MSRHSAPRVFLALALSAAALLVTSASAQATWSDKYPAKGYHCSGSVMAPHVRPVSMQSCVIVTDGPNRAYVQGAVKVSNLNENPKRLIRPTGYTRVRLDGKTYRNDNCGPITIAGGRTKWCYGKTMPIPKILGPNRNVFATGFVWSGAGIHDAVNSPPWKISPLPSIPNLRAKIVSILHREAANPAHNHEVGAADCNFYSGALGRGDRDRRCRNGYRSEPWCADFGQWVWREAGASTKHLNARAFSFKNYGERLRTWHDGKSLSGIQLGDAVVLSRKGGNHVAFVTKVNRDRSVSTISGNSSNKVRTKPYAPGAPHLMGFSSPVAR